MKAIKTFYIGLFVTILSTIQLILSQDPIRFIGISIGLFFIIFGWKIGWTTHKKFTLLLGHFTLTLGCLLTAYAAYQIPFLENPPTFLEVLDLPLFWGIFTIFGGYCMITHGYCSCAIRCHEKNNR